MLRYRGIMPAKRCDLRRVVVCDLLANVEIIALGLFPGSLPERQSLVRGLSQSLR